MEIAFFIFNILYCFGVVWLFYHWKAIILFELDKQKLHSGTLVSIIIPVRNEEKNIDQLLQDLAGQQSVFLEDIEVLVVNDQSTDHTVDIINRFKEKSSLRVSVLPLVLPTDFVGSHKKMALTHAIQQAQGDIILTTDGDCRVGQYWVASLIEYFSRFNVVMVSAPVTFCGEHTLFQHLQTIEFASLIVTGAACMQANRPNMCNGANLAFLKDTFFKVNGYEGSVHIPSGDDEFLMQKMHQHYPGRVAFIKSNTAIVRTQPQSSMSAFYHQRRRWAGKWKLHKNLAVMLTALMVFTYHLFLVLLVGAGVLGLTSWKWILPAILLKSIFEFVLLRDILTFLGKKMLLANFVLLQFIYSAYVVFFGICANFGRYTWKNRSYK